MGWWLRWDGREQKVGFAEKKHAYSKKIAHRVYQEWDVPTCGGLPRPTLSRLMALAAAVSKLRSASPRLQVVHNMPSPMAAYPSRQFDKYDKFET